MVSITSSFAIKDTIDLLQYSNYFRHFQANFQYLWKVFCLILIAQTDMDSQPFHFELASFPSRYRM